MSDEPEPQPGDARSTAPRDWLVDPDQFGRAPQPRWKTGANSIEQGRIGGAIHLHNVVRQIQAIINERPRSKAPSNRALAASIGVHPDTISDIFAGRTHATLTHLAAIADALGADLTVSIDKVDD